MSWLSWHWHWMVYLYHNSPNEIVDASAPGLAPAVLSINCTQQTYLFSFMTLTHFLAQNRQYSPDKHSPSLGQILKMGFRDMRWPSWEQVKTTATLSFSDRTNQILSIMILPACFIDKQTVTPERGGIWQRSYSCQWHSQHQSFTMPLVPCMAHV